MSAGPRPWPPPLVVGIGNPDRGDDALGLEVVARLRALPVPELRAMVCQGDLSRLLDEWTGAPIAVIVDAMAPSGVPGRVVRWEVGATHPFPGRTWGSTHALRLGEVIDLGRALERLPVRLVVFGMEAESASPGDPLSSAVAGALPGLVAMVRQELTDAQAGLSGGPPGHPDAPAGRAHIHA